MTPEHLFNSFTDAITKKPSSVMAIIACEMKDIFRSNVAFIGNTIPQINEKAFYQHWNNLKSEDGVNIKDANNHFRDFLLQTWLNEISQFTIRSSKNGKFLDALNNYGIENDMDKIKSEDVLINDIIKLGAHYSTISIDINQRSEKKIQFGDMFQRKDSDEVLLSITPHCDSIRPEKINNLLHFIKGTILKTDAEKKTALENSETDFYSFVIIDNLPICIKWIAKPFTIFIAEGKNDCTKEIEIDLRGKACKLEHKVILKENYTQRIANQAFSHAMRVGITLPSLKN